MQIQRTVYNSEQFRLVLDHERGKQDHLNPQFSLLLIRIENEAECIQCIEAIASHVRGTDIVGMYDSTHVGIILPDTSVTGAWVVESRLGHLLDARHISAGLRINTLMYSEMQHDHFYRPFNTNLSIV